MTSIVVVHGITSFVFTVRDSMRVLALKLAIENIHGFRVAHQRLYLAGTELENHRTIASYGIDSTSVLKLITVPNNLS